MMSSLRMTPRTLLAVVALALVGMSPAYAGGPNDDILGTWRLTKVLDSSDISAIDDREAARLVGKTFIVRPDKVSLAGESCDAPDFNRHYEDTVRYLREEAHAPSGRLGLATVVTVVDLACTEALLKSHGKIVVYWKGYFFDAVKQSDAGTPLVKKR